MNPIHPAEILLEEFLIPMHLSQNKIATDIGVAPRRINEVVHAAESPNHQIQVTGRGAVDFDSSFLTRT